MAPSARIAAAWSAFPRWKASPPGSAPTSATSAAKFTVKVGTVFESSHVALHIWLQAVALLTSSKKGISSNQLHRTLGVTLKTAWFMSHRVREAMRDGKLAPMGGNGGIVEMDETYHGKVATPRDVTTSGRPYTKSGKTGPSNKRAIVSLVERGGKVRSFHVEHADKSTVTKIVNENLDHEARASTPTKAASTTI